MNLCRLCLSPDELSTDLSKTLLEEMPDKSKESIKDVLIKVFQIQVVFKARVDLAN